MSTLETLISWGDHLRLGTIQRSDVPEGIVSDARSIRPRDISAYIESHPAVGRIGKSQTHSLLIWKLDLYSSLLVVAGGTGYELLDQATPEADGIEKPEDVLRHLSRIPHRPQDLEPARHWWAFSRFYEDEGFEEDDEDDDFLMHPSGRAIVSCVPTAWIWKVWPPIPSTKACGFAFCSASSDISESITFGSGILHPSGYWSHPCVRCEEAWLSKYGSLS